MSLSFPVYLSLQFSYRGEGYKAEVHSGGEIPALPLAEQGGAETKVAEDAEDGENDRDRDLGMMVMMIMLMMIRRVMMRITMTGSRTR